MVPKKKSAFSHPELTLLPLCRIVSQGGRDKEIDAYCRSVGAKDWLDLFNRYPKFNETAINNGGSSNHPADNSAVGLCHSLTRDLAIESWKRAAEMESSTVGFELNEPGSRLDYKTWSLIARLIGYRELGGEWCDGYFDKWLRLYTGLELLSTVVLEDGPFSLRCGARSQGVFDRTKADYFITKVTYEKWSWRSKPHPLPDKSWQKSDEIIAIDNLSEVIDQINTNDENLPNWPILNPTHYYKTTGGLAVWCERADLNSNTPGISAMVYYFGEKRLVTAPSPSRDHIRQKKVPQKIEKLVDMNGMHYLHFEQSNPGRPEMFDIPLPSGNLVYHIYHGPNGLETIR